MSFLNKNKMKVLITSCVLPTFWTHTKDDFVQLGLIYSLPLLCEWKMLHFML